VQERVYYQTSPLELERVRFQTWNHPVLEQEWNRIENPQEQVQEYFQTSLLPPELEPELLQRKNHHRQEPEQRVLAYFLQNQSLPKQVRVRLQTQVQDRREPEWWIQTQMTFYTIL
jgi:guanylate kinase